MTQKSAPQRIRDPWGERTPYGRDGEWPARVDEHLEEGVSEGDVDRWVRTASILHSNGDALDIAVKDGRIVGVRGRENDRVNRGRLGPKDLFGWQANGSSDRLKRPLVRDGNGKLVETSWDEAMERIVARSKELLERKGPLAFGFYTTGQLFLEEYYTLGVIGKAGLGTPHMDGNTRLCTATAGQALKESFGSDGQPGSYSDVDHADAILLVGHNMAETQSVTWMHVLDRLAGEDPPKLVVVDPRRTPVAEAAAVHLPVRNGTNLALLNALVRELIANDWIDREYVEAHTLGFEELEATVRECTPEWAEEVCGVPAERVREAARVIGTEERLLSTVLQGVYQSHQATASACAVNNIHLLRGMLGRPGCGVLQFNGQPTAQNTRETGANGDLPAFRNWDNPEHIQQLADLWNVDRMVIPHWAPPTHAMQIFRYAEQGSIELLWISGTNPAVSLPDLSRIREILRKEDLFVVAQDIFPTETTELADVVLPAATWGEKTGTYTNTDRTVHLSEAAVEPPGEARHDLDIFLDYARRMDLRDKDGAPLIKWAHPEEAFEAWKACTRGRLCDYTGLTYEKLRGESGIQWPCNAQNPDGTERLYRDADFNTHTETCETYGHDLLTGATNSEKEHRAMAPEGRALLKAASYTPPHEEPGESYPLRLTTGRTIYHFHTRTKTARAPELNAAAPEAWVEMNRSDAESAGVGEGDVVRVESPRGWFEAPARLTEIKEGVVFAPFHYGYFDSEEARPGRHPRAANEATITSWDPVSKQPLFKVAAVKVTKVGNGG
ncbi:Anaerobic dehydrogenases typically selenocysteine-containing [Rubrobacter radiotolerans]|uniref:Anaerobic dehydrogenases typically selenocysteine-containing n=1 Tax=Rubrobacter radiotolerans TaxID=42256 RepID=A0A023X6G6_RUBRA|nr:nitrate reductase [Rubrobacter radiotolerans]AHY47649.1 Anaerobic dehydrogenases typically selenocysteine-containing [Rubrobacter radiotolerans]MDX5895052.1 nitrate reductase [Rubrobacter radiotolerans]SMC07349.1 Anaerobic selenocysteine-containing dehydrogenase [Rubrobacter radiotolerans DSM 5868]